jgi:hypothetical protein
MEMRGRLFAVTIGLLAAGAASAQDAWDLSPSLEFGARWWVNTGSTSRSHDASAVDPTVGNPTSTLAYTNLDANAGELFARKRIGERWFVKGNVGLGQVNTGKLTDQDFFFSPTGVPLMTQTTTATDGKLNYASIDLGREMWKHGIATFSLFAGYQYWNERIDGHGFSDSFGPVGLPPSVLVISNNLTWQSLRLGGDMRLVRGRQRVVVDVALVPYAKYRNEDSHFLRQDADDLGPVPNVIANGHGWGVQAEAEWRIAVPQMNGVEFGVGYRYWRLESTSGNQSQAGFTFPITELWSERHGFTLSLNKTW